jgi:hypothetical protein
MVKEKMMSQTQTKMAQTRFITQNKAKILAQTILTQEELISFLESAGIQFTLEGNVIKIRGQVYYSSWGYVSSIVIITDNNKKIVFEEFLEQNRIIVENGETTYYANTFKNVTAYYSYPHLILRA